MSVLDDAAEWAKLRADPHNPAKDQRGSLFEHLGVEADDPLRVIGIVNEETYSQQLSGWCIGTKPANLGSLAKAGLLGLACRLAGGAERFAAQRERLAKEESERREHELEVARAHATTAKAAADQVVLALPADQATAHREHEARLADQASRDAAAQRDHERLQIAAKFAPETVRVMLPEAAGPAALPWTAGGTAAAPGAPALENAPAPPTDGGAPTAPPGATGTQTPRVDLTHGGSDDEQDGQKPGTHDEQSLGQRMKFSLLQVGGAADHGSRASRGGAPPGAAPPPQPSLQAVQAQGPQAASGQQLLANPISGGYTQTVKLACVSDQASDLEVPLLPHATIEEMWSRYIEMTGDEPPPREEPSESQLTALHALLAGGGVPYVDFSVFGPRGNRLEKRSKFTALVMQPGGAYVRTELYGPPTFQAWMACWKVFRTAAVMLGMCSTSALDNYATLLGEYVELYSQAAWPIIYQADVHARLEHVVRIKRRVRRGALRSEAPLVPGKIWDTCFRELVADMRYWQHELVEPCGAYLTKAKSLSSLLTGDVYIDSQAQGSLGGAGGPGVKRRQPALTDVPEPPTKKPSRPKVNSKLTESGLHTVTRKGRPICEGYNTGACTATHRGSATCEADSRRAHVCSKCLMPGHGAHGCSGSAAKAIVVGGPGGGGRGGKGKGRGRGGGRS